MELNELILNLETQISKNKEVMTNIQKSNGDIWHHRYTDLVNLNKYYESFIDMLNEVSDCTCTPTERAFLDEIREKFHIDEDGDCVFPNEDAWSMIFQKQFTKCNLQELMEKKNNG